MYPTTFQIKCTIHAVTVIISLAGALDAFSQEIRGYTRVAFSADEKYIVAGNGDGELVIWDAHSGARVNQYKAQASGKVFALAMDPGGEFAYVSMLFDDCFYKIRFLTGEVVNRYCRKGTGINNISVSRSGHRALVANTWDASVGLWDLETGKEIHQYKGHRRTVSCASFSPDERFIVSTETGLGVSSVVTTHILDARTLVCIDSARSTDRNNVVKYSPNGKRIATGGVHSTLQIFAARTGKLRHTLRAGTSCMIYDLAFTPTGDGVIFAGGGTLSVWNTLTGEPIRTFDLGHSGCVRSVVVNQQGTECVSAGEDGRVYSWEIATGKKLREFK